MSNLNRRDCLKQIGAIGATPLLTNTIQGQDDTTKEENPLRKLQDREAEKAYLKAYRDESYRKLKQALIQDDYVPNPKQRTAYEVTPYNDESEKFKVAIFEYSHRKNEDQTAEVGVSLNQSAPITTRATVIKKDKNNFPTRIIYYTTDTNEVEVNGLGNQSNGISTSSKTVDLGETSVKKHIQDLSDLSPTINSGSEASIKGIHPECLDKYKGGVGNVPCWACKDIVSVVNVVTCGTATWLICGAIGVGTGSMGGLACGTIVAVVCWVINHYGTNNPTDVCTFMCSC